MKNGYFQTCSIAEHSRKLMYDKEYFQGIVVINDTYLCIILMSHNLPQKQIVFDLTFQI